MARVFLSHASSDKPQVRRIAQALRDAGHDPWLDEDQIDIGESIPAAVERGLRDTDFMIVCLSAAAARSGWASAEREVTFMQQMADRRTRILPVRLEHVDPPVLLGHILYVDLFPDDDAFRRGIARLLRALDKHAPKPAAPTAPLDRPVGTPASPDKAVPLLATAPLPAVPAAPAFEPSPPGTVDIFLSHAPPDGAFAAALETALAVLQRQRRIRLLHSGKVGAGKPRQDEILAQLDASRIVLLLISNAYLASDACEIEMRRAVERHRSGRTRVIPVLVRATDEWKQTPVGPLLALPRNEIPVAHWAHPDEAWTEITREIRAIVDHLLGPLVPGG